MLDKVNTTEELDSIFLFYFFFALTEVDGPEITLKALASTDFTLDVISCSMLAFIAFSRP